ncbi:MAG: phosphoribosylformylglycinamidine synthase subunit PurQ [Armatimonadetes bacterium]|nr:phosphoribosylformylglycinamidine synthase subunit PurQ [Armatimonadota bacterium]HOC30824.1 phosphoribosylformylglycinamidine synthase subunit PurQ [Armatimonadota bacterium]
MKFGVIIFPGSNCDMDAVHAVNDALGHEAVPIWHESESLEGSDVVIVPGGFSYGDYLRCGAIARFSPIMRAVEQHAGDGKPVIGICNGFQILTEANLLPGALHRNTGLRFLCQTVNLRVENTDTIFTRALKIGQVLRLPIAHNEGNYFAEPDVLAEIERNGRVLFRYCDEDGNVTPEANPNGSLNNIAGVVNAAGNVLGMMPHPERACEALLGSDDGLGIFRSIVGEF